MNYADNVMETMTGTSAASFTPAGAKANYRAFTAAYADNTADIPVKVGPDSAGAWELGRYTLSGGVLTRTAVLSSSAGGTTAVTFQSGSKDVTVVYPAAYAVDAENSVTLKNKRVQARVLTIGSFSATPPINTDGCDIVQLSVVSGDMGSMSTNLSGTPAHGDQMQIDFVKPTTGGTIGWGAKFIDSTIPLPAAFVTGKTLSVFLTWSAPDNAWRCTGAA